MKTFTLDEAQSLLPVLESLLKRAIDAKLSAEKIEQDLSEIARKIYLIGGMRVDVEAITAQRAELESAVKLARESVAEIDSIGVQVKDLETGLLDFPCRLDDQIVLLCWRMGEPTIEHWHTTDTGFKDRQPVDERFRRRSASGGWANWSREQRTKQPRQANPFCYPDHLLTGIPLCVAPSLASC